MFSHSFDSGSLVKRVSLFDSTTTASTVNSTYAQWASQFTNITDLSLPLGVPNFFSSTRFGYTKNLTTATKFVVVVAALAVLMRLFARSRLRCRYWWDDMLAVVAISLLFINQAIFAKVDLLGATTVSFVKETTDQREEIRRSKIVSGLQFFLAFELLYLLSLWSVKFSTLVVYLRMVKQTPLISLYLRIAFGVSAATFIFCILALFLSCVPVTEFWNITNPSPQCSQRLLLTFGTGISNIITDTLVLVVPIPLLLRAHLTKLQKIGLVVLYFFGAFVVVASALRFTTQLLNVSIQQTMSWSQIEVSLALVLACAPMTGNLLLHPVIDHQLVPLLRSPDSDTFSTYSIVRAKYNKDLPNLPQSEVERLRKENIPHVAALDNSPVQDDEEHDASSFNRYTLKPERKVIPTVRKKTVMVRDMSSLDYKKLKISKKLINGQSHWEVRPISGATTAFAQSRPSSSGGGETRPVTPYSMASRPTTAHSIGGTRMSLSEYAPSTAAWLAYPGNARGLPKSPRPLGNGIAF